LWISKSIKLRRLILAADPDFIPGMNISARKASDLLPNQSALILRFEDMIIAGKLMAMGILPQARIELVRRNALGQTLIFRINSRFKIALRKDEAMTIIIHE
jgi:Fe2+ transport system protein FeoA